LVWVALGISCVCALGCGARTGALAGADEMRASAPSEGGSSPRAPIAGTGGAKSAPVGLGGHAGASEMPGTLGGSGGSSPPVAAGGFSAAGGSAGGGSAGHADGGSAEQSGGTAGSPSTGASGATDVDAGAGTAGAPVTNCCFAHAGPSCDNPRLAACVCMGLPTVEGDIFCCMNQWDDQCAGDIERYKCGRCPEQ